MSRVYDKPGFGKKAFFYIGLILLFLLWEGVFIWLFTGSFKTNIQISSSPPVFFFKPTLDNYRKIFFEQPFLLYLMNSMIISLGATAIGLLLGLPAAFVIGRYRMSKFSIFLLAARIMPFICYVIPWFMIFRMLGLYDTYYAMIIMNLFITLPLTVVTMVGFFEDIPIEYEEAARLDGCSRFTSFIKVIIPLARSGIVVTVIMDFIFSWNNFLFPLIFAGENTKPLPMLVFNFVEFESMNLGGMYAAAALITLPVLIMVFLVQRQLVQGLTMGGVKG